MSAPGRATANAPIAIVGIGCRFPGGIVDPESFWRVVANGVDAITEIPVERFDVTPFFDPKPGKRGRISTRWGGFVEQRLDEFDAQFFGISRTYAERLDPQQRLLLETTWEAMEDAGLDIAGLEGSRTAVFVGQWVSDFEHQVFADTSNIDFQMAMGSGRYAAAGRVSFAFGFRGPCLSIDAACSSGLASVHLAVQSLRTGESTLAVAGGVNLILEPHIHLAYSYSRMMAPDGRCRFGDANGVGYVRAEGAGMVVLKRLDEALADGDHVYAVIRGSAVNSDGDSSGALGRPSRIGQEELIRSALSDGGVHQSQLTYVEAHGTGTKVGDPVEIDALAKVLADERPEGASPTWVGSVKTNFGHTEAAAGVAGLIKAALMMEHGQIPPSLHFVTPNPAIAWDTMPIAIPTTLMPWPARDGERFAGVSSYGIGGTNAHVVLQAAVYPGMQPSDETPDARAQLLVVSGHTRDALRDRIATTAAWLEAGAGASLPLHVTARTAALRRDHFPHRASVVGGSTAEVAAALRALMVDDKPRALTHKRIGFVFSGEGSQWAGMARTLLATEPVFADAIDACANAMRPHVAWSLRDVLTADVLPDDIDMVRPAVFAMQVALAALWRSWGVVPAGVVGHGIGEVAAAQEAGALTLADACRIVCAPGELAAWSLHPAAGSAGYDAALDASYWRDGERHRMRLADAVMAMAEAPIDLYLEVSPHPVLAEALPAMLAHRAGATLVLTSQRRDVDGRTVMLHALGAIYQAGVTPGWAQAFAPGTAIVALPTYPFQRERCWYETSPHAKKAGALLGPRISTAATGGGAEWDLRLPPSPVPLMPAAAVLQAMLTAARELFGATAATIELQQVTFQDAIPPAAANVVHVGAGGDSRLRLTATTAAPGSIRFEVRARDGSDPSPWRTVATGNAERLSEGAGIDVVRDAGSTPDALLSVPDDAEGGGAVLLLDGALQVLLGRAPAGATDADTTLVPVSVDRIRVWQASWPATAQVRVRLDSLPSTIGMRGSVQLTASDGQVICDADGIEFAVSRDAVAETANAHAHTADTPA